ncbi:MAG: hypothetical protein K2N94_10195 [Lachnospiraceae bacterium]|nr:hypothetical protein [Lachnospiraceae bacterium]
MDYVFVMDEDVTEPADSAVTNGKTAGLEYGLVANEEAAGLEYGPSMDEAAAGQVVSAGNCIFTAPKHYRFENPGLSCRVEGNEVVVAAKAFAQKVWIEGTDGDVRFSDNCFDMQAGERRVKIVSGSAGSFKVRSVYDIA